MSIETVGASEAAAGADGVVALDGAASVGEATTGASGVMVLSWRAIGMFVVVSDCRACVNQVAAIRFVFDAVAGSLAASGVLAAAAGAGEVAES
jgi:hypothetical protein